MKLPNGDQAIVEDRKLLDYVLNPLHPVGRHHAYLFERLLGIRRSNHVLLKEALLTAARVEDTIRQEANEHGTKYEMRFPLTGPSGSRIVLAVWLIETGSGVPRLITCFVE